VVLEALKQATRFVESRHLPSHAAFWSTRWPLVVTTNFDHFLELGAGGQNRVQTVGYEKERLTQLFKDETRRDDIPTILHLHGDLDDNTSPPLLTWGDYLNAYGDDRDQLIEHLVGTSPPSLTKAQRRRYHQILLAVLSNARVSWSEPSRIRALIDRLLGDYECLFVGFSVADPGWQLILKSLTKTRDLSRHHMITTVGSGARTRIASARISAVNIRDWAALPALFDDLGVWIGRRGQALGTGENRSRLNHYEELQRRYPKLARLWMIRGYKGDQSVERAIIPFVELWHNVKGLHPQRALECRVDSDEPFRLRKELRVSFWDG
jgi:hypothetical protein